MAGRQCESHVGGSGIYDVSDVHSLSAQAVLNHLQNILLGEDKVLHPRMPLHFPLEAPLALYDVPVDFPAENRLMP